MSASIKNIPVMVLKLLTIAWHATNDPTMVHSRQLHSTAENDRHEHHAKKTFASENIVVIVTDHL